MFTSYYELQAHPFERQPDPRFFFDANQQRGALAALEKGLLAGGGFTVITGGEGMGKTALLDFALSRLDLGQFTSARLIAVPIGPDDMLRETASVFGLDCDELSGAETRQRLAEYFTNCLKSGRYPVLFVDRAERLLIASLRELGALADIRLDDEQALHIVLLGRTQLRQTLAGEDFATQARNRVGGYHLQPLDGDDARRLIEHRLRLAGWQDDPDISNGAFEMMYLKTGGVPGRIISFCTELFEFAAANTRHSIGNNLVRQVAAKQQKDRLKGERGAAAAIRAESSDWFRVPENPPGLELAGMSISSETSPPSGWRRAITCGEYAVGIAITVLVAWQVGNGLFGQGSSSTQAVETVTIALPTEPAKSVPASRPSNNPDAVATAAMPETESGDGPPASVADAPESDSPTLYIIDFGDKMNPETAAAETARPVAETDPLASRAPVIAAEVSLPPAPAQRQQDTGVDESQDPNEDLFAELAAASPDKPDGAQPETPIMDVSDKLSALAEPEIPRIIPAVESSSVALTESAPLSTPDDQDQSLLAVAVSEPLSLLPGKPALAPVRFALNSAVVSDKQLALDALPAPPIDLQDHAIPAAVAPAEPETAAMARSPAQRELKKPAALLGIGYTRPLKPAVILAQSEPAATQGDTAASPGLAVTAVTLTRGVVDKEPIDATDWFAASDGEVYAFVRIKNPGAPTQVTFNWYRGDLLAASTELEVGHSASWRTWSKSRIQPGLWRVAITDESGKLLAENAFTVE